MHPALAALVLTVLAGCTLVDQRSFRREGAAPGTEELARAGASARLVASVRLDQPGDTWRAALAESVQAAQQREPGATFEVVALVPLQAAPGEQERRVTEASRDARTVAEAMGAAGIAPDRVRLGLLGDAGTPAREVRVFRR